ncbi:MAG: hypothetical protein ACHQ9S_18120 [Candidatus Binatia bacterium]
MDARTARLTAAALRRLVLSMLWPRPDNDGRAAREQLIDWAIRLGFAAVAALTLYILVTR